VALRSTPGYAAKKNPKNAPTRPTTLFSHTPRDRPASSSRVSRAARNAQAEKPSRAHAPIDIGESGLNLSTMFMKRTGTPRSTIRMIGHGIRATRAR